MPFKLVFKVKKNRSVIPLFDIKIGGVIVGKNTVITPGTILGGIDLTQYADRGLSVEIDSATGEYIIKGIY